jgi:hypothetical protein
MMKAGSSESVQPWGDRGFGRQGCLLRASSKIVHQGELDHNAYLGFGIDFVDTEYNLSKNCRMKKMIAVGTLLLGTANAYACSDSDVLRSGPVVSFLAVLAGSIALFLIVSKVTARLNVPAAKRLSFLLSILFLLTGVSLTLPAAIKVLSNKGC